MEIWRNILKLCCPTSNGAQTTSHPKNTFEVLQSDAWMTREVQMLLKKWKITFLTSASLPHPKMSLTSSSIRHFLWSAFNIFLLSVSYFLHSVSTWLTASFSSHWQFPVGCFPIMNRVLFSLLCPILILLRVICSFLMFPLFTILPFEFWTLCRCLPLVSPSQNCCHFYPSSLQIMLFPSDFESLTLISTFPLFTATLANLLSLAFLLTHLDWVS